MAESLSPRSHPQGSDAPETVDPEVSVRAVADYLGDMIGQLESMARLQGFDLLVYLLSMARVEAESTARAARRSSS